MQFSGSPKPKGGGNFLRLKDNDLVRGVFRGEPVEFYNKWENGKSHACDAYEEGARFRFRINFVTRENDTLVAKIFEQGPTVYQMLKDLHQEYNLEETIVTIKRTGNDLNNTSYTILPAKENKVASEMEEQLKKLALNDLTPRQPKEDPQQ